MRYTVLVIVDCPANLHEMRHNNIDLLYRLLTQDNYSYGKCALENIESQGVMRRRTCKDGLVGDDYSN